MAAERTSSVTRLAARTTSRRVLTTAAGGALLLALAATLWLLATSHHAVWNPADPIGGKQELNLPYGVSVGGRIAALAVAAYGALVLVTLLVRSIAAAIRPPAAAAPAATPAGPR